jgi:hypothetical protein
MATKHNQPREIRAPHKLWRLRPLLEALAIAAGIAYLWASPAAGHGSYILALTVSVVTIVALAYGR